MSKKSPNALKKSKDLQQKAYKKDESLKMGESWKFDEFRVLLIKSEEDPEEYVETGKVICVNCKILLTKMDGSHFNRHMNSCKSRQKKRVTVTEKSENCQDSCKNTVSEPSAKLRKIDDYNWKKLKTGELAAATNAIAKYCVTSGKSYNHCSSPELRSLVVDLFNSISSGYGIETKSQLPSRQTIQRRSDEMCKELISKAYEFLKPFLSKRRVNLIADHGKHVINYLSLYASVIDDDFCLQIVPLAFMPATEGKSGYETAKLIVSRLESYGWSVEDIKACAVTADGALGSLSNYFSTYIRCVSHAINLLGDNGTDPADFQKKRLSNEDLERLVVVKDLLKSAESLSIAIRSNNEICEAIPRLPALPGETRWLSSLKCLRDIYELQDDLEKIDQKLNASGALAYKKIMRKQRKIGKSIILVFGDLLFHSQTFQSQNHVTTQLVAPTFKLIQQSWKRLVSCEFDELEMDEYSEDFVISLAKSGLEAQEKYFKAISKAPLHFAAVLLSPQHKKMKLFDDSEIAEAKKFINDKLPTEQTTNNATTTTRKPTAVSLLSKLLADKSERQDSRNTELRRYLMEEVDEYSEETLEEYWRRKKVEFPNLFNVAASIYSVVPSESVCETCFSVAGYLLDRRRKRLQYSRAELIVVGSQISKKYPDWMIECENKFSVI